MKFPEDNRMMPNLHCSFPTEMSLCESGFTHNKSVHLIYRWFTYHCKFCPNKAKKENKNTPLNALNPLDHVVKLLKNEIITNHRKQFCSEKPERQEDNSPQPQKVTALCVI